MQQKDMQRIRRTCVQPKTFTCVNQYRKTFAKPHSSQIYQEKSEREETLTKSGMGMLTYYADTD